MTKAEELALLDKFIASLKRRGGKGGSYIAPWLEGQRTCIEQAITSDLCPSVNALSYEEFAAHRKRLVDEADLKAELTVIAANEKATKLTDDADRHAQSVRDSIHSALRELNR